VKVRIRAKPQEREIDGIKLDGFVPGVVKDVPSSLGSWLVAEGYAVPEMRREERRPKRLTNLLDERDRFRGGRPPTRLR
jgi:hypothetical protein